MNMFPFAKRASSEYGLGDDVDQNTAIDNTAVKDRSKIYDAEPSLDESARIALVADAYNELLGSPTAFNEQVEQWLSNRTSPEEIKQQIHHDLNYDPSIAEIIYMLNSVLEQRVSSAKCIPYKRGYVAYMTKVASNKYRSMNLTWEIKAFKDSDGQERMYLVRVEDSREG